MAGRTGGRRVELHVADARTPDEARQAVDRLVDADHVTVILGAYASGLAEAAAARADQRGVTYWETGAVSDGVTRNRRHVFRTVATGSNLGRTAVKFTARAVLPAAGLQAGGSKAVIVNVDDVYGRSVAEGEARQAAAMGIQVAGQVSYNPLAFDPAQVVARVAAAHPDFLWDVSYLDDGIAIWRQVVRQRLPLRAAVGTSSAFCMPDFGRTLGPDAVGVFAADKPDAQINPAALRPEARALLAQAVSGYRSAGEGSTMSIPAVAGFVGGWALFHDVVPRAGGTSAEDIARAARALDLPEGSTINGGGIRFAAPGTPEAGQNLRAASVVGQWQGVQQMRVVYPDGYAQAQPILR
jgi:branched-chain amino acid transport system substrate-binding protein